MTETVVAVNDYWFDVLRYTVVCAPKAVANVASRRISEKTGMRLIATLEGDYVSGRVRQKSGKLQPRNGVLRAQSLFWSGVPSILINRPYAASFVFDRFAVIGRTRS
jgi:RimJ/RimL family protein N-acetyltransferase